MCTFPKSKLIIHIEFIFLVFSLFITVYFSFIRNDITNEKLKLFERKMQFIFD